MTRSKTNSIIIKNEYYPKGLRENTIYDYYIKNKMDIIFGAINNKIALLIAVDVNKFVIRRQINNKDIKLNLDNYEKIIHPRVVSIYVEIPPVSNIWCIDIDSGGSVSENRMKEAVRRVVDIFKELYEDGLTISRGFYRITSTATGYHVFGFMKKIQTTEKNFEDAFYYFKKLENYGYIYNKKKYSSRDIIIDFSPMRRRGMYILPWSICKNGLICMNVTTILDKFKREYAIIK